VFLKGYGSDAGGPKPGTQNAPVGLYGPSAFVSALASIASSPSSSSRHPGGQVWSRGNDCGAAYHAIASDAARLSSRGRALPARRFGPTANT
jgi:hypothetical protein